MSLRAGSLVIVLVWVYYSSQILFFGAELTRFYAKHAHSPVCPKGHAMWMSSPDALAEPTVGDATSPGKSRIPRKPVRAEPIHSKDWKKGFRPFPSLVLLALMFWPLRRRKH